MPSKTRNDASLYSGLTAPVRREKLEQAAQENKPDGKADMVLSEIAALKAAAMDVSKIVLDDSLPNEAKLRQLERMKERYADLNTLERRMQKLLGVKP